MYVKTDVRKTHKDKITHQRIKGYLGIMSLDIMIREATNMVWSCQRCLDMQFNVGFSRRELHIVWRAKIYVALIQAALGISCNDDDGDDYRLYSLSKFCDYWISRL